MKIELPLDVKNIIKTLEENGHAAYAVGGCVSILGEIPKDWDITTSAKPEDVKALFKKTIDTGIQHGTVTVMLGKNAYEVTTFRVDGEYLDGRHPENVEFTNNLSEDLKRRDFTINAMAYNDDVGLVDEFDGISDLKKGVIKCVGEPKERFSEDALRMLRAIRFAARFGFAIENKTYEAICELAPTLSKVSAERIREEFVKIICSDNPDRLYELYKTGLSKVFIPEWDAMEETEQNSPHHIYNVADHTVMVIQGVESKYKILRLAAFFHDVGKPECKTTDENGRDHFNGHPQVGAGMTGKIMRRLKFDNNTIKRVQRLVRFHDERPGNTERAARRLLNRMGSDIAGELILLKTADILAQSDYLREEKVQNLMDLRDNLESVINKKQAICIKDLKINGKDLMNLGLESGPKIGIVLKELLNHVIDQPQDNTRDKLLELAREIIESGEEGNL